MRIELDKLGQLKQWLYVAATGTLFLTWCLSLAALTQSGGVDGRVAWVFGLCFLTIPMLIYQSLTPIWSRTARYSNPHAHCAVDGLLVLLWLSAWASLASFVLSGKGQGEAKGSDGKALEGCDNFSHGSATKCKVSEADIIFSVILMLLFVATSFFSFKVLYEFKRTGVSPNMNLSSAKVSKTDISYPQSYKEDEEVFDSRLNVDHGRDTGYSFEDARVQGGAPGGYGGLGQPGNMPYGSGYASVPADDGYSHGPENGRPTSFGGPLNRI